MNGINPDLSQPGSLFETQKNERVLGDCFLKSFKGDMQLMSFYMHRGMAILECYILNLLLNPE